MRDNGGERDTFSVPTSYFITTLPPPQNKNEANKLEIYESNNNCNIEVDESGGGPDFQILLILVGQFYVNYLRYIRHKLKG